MIDFHCHLDLYPEPRKVVNECIQRGLHVLSVTTTPSAWRGALQLAGNARRIRIALGLHPELAAERKSELDLFDELLPETRYIGEVGLDGTPSIQSTWSDQTYVFEHILRGCKAAGGRIISIHSRRAVSDVLERLELFKGAGVPVLHWYSGNKSDLQRAIDLGCWFSVGPAMLAGEKGRAILASMPRDRLLTETDGPFGTSNGKPLLPWDAQHAINAIASIVRSDAEEIRGTIDDNLRKLSSAL